jgi:hypothetical protein
MRRMTLCSSSVVLVAFSPLMLDAQAGTAVVEMVALGPSAAATFEFTGVPSGSVMAGSSLQAASLAAGSYTTTLTPPSPEWVLVAITCDDGGSSVPSRGDLVGRSATFNIEAGETVTCTFQMATGEAQSGSSGTQTGGTAAGDQSNPFSHPDDGWENFPLPADLPPTAGTFAVPKGGPWNVSNHSGQMVCGGFSVPLREASDRGTLDVRDGGQTIVGTGLSDDTAPITMRAVSGVTGRYAGSVGGSQDGIPMTINFFWQLVSDEWIVGYLTSTVSAQGMTCNMFRTFELRYAGG